MARTLGGPRFCPARQLSSGRDVVDAGASRGSPGLVKKQFVSQAESSRQSTSAFASPPPQFPRAGRGPATGATQQVVLQGAVLSLGPRIFKRRAVSVPGLCLGGGLPRSAGGCSPPQEQTARKEGTYRDARAARRAVLAHSLNMSLRHHSPSISLSVSFQIR